MHELQENCHAQGHYEVECIGPDGTLKWRDSVANVVCTVGKTLALDAFLSASNYGVTGPYVGLISSVSWTAVSAGDTMTSHSGWTEAGGANAPTYSGTRKTAVWAAASAGSKSFSGPASFTLTSDGTVKGYFLVFGNSAVNTIDSTTGTLWSAGAFSAGDKVVSSGDTLNVNYTTSL